jgi:hypothetical protein
MKRQRRKYIQTANAIKIKDSAVNIPIHVTAGEVYPAEEILVSFYAIFIFIKSSSHRVIRIVILVGILVEICFIRLNFLSISDMRLRPVLYPIVFREYGVESPPTRGFR